MSHFKKTDTLSKVSSNISWLASDKVFEWIVTLFIGIWMARYLGPDVLGQLNYALAFVALFIPLAELGMTTIVIRSVVESPEDSNEILGTSLVVYLMTGFITGTLILYIIWFVRPAEGIIPWFVTLLTITIILRSTDVFKWWNQSQVASKYTVWATRAGMVVAATFKVVLILLNAPVAVIIWAWLLQNLVGAFLLVFLYQRNFGSIFNFRFHLSCARHLLTNSWPLIFTGIASIIYLKIDKIMLGDLASSYDVGIYSAASRISELWYFLPTVVIGSLFPSIIRSKKLDEATYYQRIQALFDSMALYGIGVAVVITLGAPYIIDLLYGDKFAAAAPILRVHTWALIFVATGVVRNRWFIAENTTGFIMVATIIGTIINVSMNMILIPLYGGLGAAWATVVSYGVSTYISCGLWRPMWSAFGMLSKSYIIPLRLRSLYDTASDILESRIK
ncbi:MAG: flippase [Chloroflexota bacterium]